MIKNYNNSDKELQKTVRKCLFRNYATIFDYAGIFFSFCDGIVGFDFVNIIENNPAIISETEEDLSELTGNEDNSLGKRFTFLDILLLRIVNRVFLSSHVNDMANVRSDEIRPKDVFEYETSYSAQKIYKIKRILNIIPSTTTTKFVLYNEFRGIIEHFILDTGAYKDISLFSGEFWEQIDELWKVFIKNVTIIQIKYLYDEQFNLRENVLQNLIAKAYHTITQKRRNSISNYPVREQTLVKNSQEQLNKIMVAMYDEVPITNHDGIVEMLITISDTKDKENTFGLYKNKIRKTVLGLKFAEDETELKLGIDLPEFTYCSPVSDNDRTEKPSVQEFKYTLNELCYEFFTRIRSYDMVNVLIAYAFSHQRLNYNAIQYIEEYDYKYTDMTTCSYTFPDGDIMEREPCNFIKVENNIEKSDEDKYMLDLIYLIPSISRIKTIIPQQLLNSKLEEMKRQSGSFLVYSNSNCEQILDDWEQVLFVLSEDGINEQIPIKSLFVKNKYNNNIECYYRGLSDIENINTVFINDNPAEIEKNFVIKKITRKYINGK